MSLAAAIESELGVTARVVAGSPGQFEVFKNGELIIGKDKVGILARLLGNKGIPDEERVLELLRA